MLQSEAKSKFDSSATAPKPTKFDSVYHLSLHIARGELVKTKLLTKGVLPTVMADPQADQIDRLTLPRRAFLARSAAVQGIPEHKNVYLLSIVKDLFVMNNMDAIRT